MQDFEKFLKEKWNFVKNRKNGNKILFGEMLVI